MTIRHNSRLPKYRAPFGAQPCKTEVRLFLETDEPEATIRFWLNEHAYLYKMTPAKGGFEYTFMLPEEPGILWYYFICGKHYYGNAGDNLGGEGEIYLHEPPSFQITVYDPAYETPDWLGDGILLQIMPDRFYRGADYPVKGRLHADWYESPEMRLSIAGDNEADDFFGGDIPGITEKLPYIKSLGVSVLYLNPIFLAHSNHKYDTSDFRQIDPAFGTEDDFRTLCRKAREAGIRVILDGVFSHTGADSVYFNKNKRFPTVGAYNSRKSQYAGWYTFHKWPKDYDAWWGFQTLPNVNKNAESFRDFIIHAPDSVAVHWLRAGASGWRLDVADEMPMDFLAALRKRVKEENPNAALIGEVWEDPSRKIAYDALRSYCLGDTLDCTMNYPLREAILDFFLGKKTAGSFSRVVDSLQENMPWAFFRSQMNLLSSHDKPRALTVLADVGNMEPARKYRYPIKLTREQYARGKRRLIAAWKLVCALPGMPAIYYGDEAGLYGMSDPFCRAAYPWGREDAELIEAFRAGAAYRRAHPVLRHGTLTIEAVSDDLLVVRRTLDGETAELIVNRGEEPIDYAGRKVPGESAEWL